MAYVIIIHNFIKLTLITLSNVSGSICNKSSNKVMEDIPNQLIDITVTYKYSYDICFYFDMPSKVILYELISNTLYDIGTFSFPKKICVNRMMDCQKSWFKPQKVDKKGVKR